MTTSTQKKLSTSLSDDHSKTRVTDKNQTCVHCGDPAGYLPKAHQYQDFPNASLLCQSCGNKNTDSLSFYVIDKETNCLASPEFSTLDEAKQFADIFGMTSYAGYGLRSSTYLFNGQRDEQARREYQERIAWGRQIRTRLLELLPAYQEPGDLKRLALFLHLSIYSLPQFREQTIAGRVD